MMDEEELCRLYSAERVRQIKRYCLANGQWQFDKYEPSKVLYSVTTEQTKENLRLELESAVASSALT